MDILVGNEMKEIIIIDEVTGCEYTQDLIGNNNGFDDYDEEKELYTMSPESYDWWKEYINVEKRIARKVQSIKSGMSNCEWEVFEAGFVNAGDNDLESHQFSQLEFVKNYQY